MFGYIYKTTNTINNKIYIGQHQRTTFDKSYFGSGSLLRKAIEKYGIENFVCELIEECCSFDELNCKEKFYIALYNSNNLEKGYNLTTGGQGISGYKHTIETKSKIKQNNAKYWKNKFLSEETKQKLSLSHKGKITTKETVKKLSRKLKGHPYWGPKESYWKTHKFSDEHREKIRKALLGKTPANKGVKFTDEQRLNISLKTKEAMKRPEVQKKLRERPRTEELKKKLSDSIKGRKFVTNGFINKQVKPEEIQKYIEQGFHLGLTKGLKK